MPDGEAISTTKAPVKSYDTDSGACKCTIEFYIIKNKPMYLIIKAFFLLVSSWKTMAGKLIFAI